MIIPDPEVDAGEWQAGGPGMISPADVIHDLQFCINLWKAEAEKNLRIQEELKKEYGVTIEDGDEWYLQFTIGDQLFSWDYGKEKLYLGDVDEGEPVKSGEPFDFATALHSAIMATYRTVENEMEKRGWQLDPEEYHYILYKEGWQVDLAYYPRSLDDADDFRYEPDEPGYYWPVPFVDIVHTALFQIRWAQGHFTGFKLSDFENPEVKV